MKPEMNAAPPISNAADAAALLAAGNEPIVITPANLPDDGTVKPENGTTIAAPAHGPVDGEVTDIQIKLAAIIPSLNQPNTGSGGKDDSIHQGVTPAAPVVGAVIVSKAPPTEHEIWASPLATQMRDLISAHWRTLPSAAAWVEPTPAQINEKVMALLMARGHALTDFAAIVAIATEVNAQISADRAAATNSDNEKFLKLRASAIMDLLTGDVMKHVKTLGGIKDRTKKPTQIEANAAKIATSAAAITPSATVGKRARQAQTMLAWGKEHGLGDRMYRICRAYGNIYALEILPDGTYRVCTFDATTNKVTHTDQIVNRLWYFTNPEDASKPIAMNARDYWNLLMVNEAGEQVDIDGVNNVNADGVKQDDYSAIAPYGRLASSLGV